MKRQSYRKRFVRAMAALAVGGSALQLSGCDPAVRDTVIAGLESTSQSMASALISALFISLQADANATNGV